LTVFADRITLRPFPRNSKLSAATIQPLPAPLETQTLTSWEKIMKPAPAVIEQRSKGKPDVRPEIAPSRPVPEVAPQKTPRPEIAPEKTPRPIPEVAPQTPRPIPEVAPQYPEKSPRPVPEVAPEKTPRPIPEVAPDYPKKKDY